MTVHITVMDPLPAFRHGVAAALSSLGHHVEESADAAAWLRDRPGGMLLLTVDSADDLERLTILCRLRPRPLVVALPSENVSAVGVRAVRAGARSVVARAAPVPVLQRTVTATLQGEAIMPADVADLLIAEHDGRPLVRSPPPAHQVAWLRQLSAGSTVAHLAVETGYSERAMYRLLHALYRQIGVGTRLEAILVAQREGWFEA